MTDPREPETTLDEGESTRPIGQPDAASWYPVDPARPEPEEAEAPAEAPEPTVDEPFAEAPTAEVPVAEVPPAEVPAADEPVAEAPAVAHPFAPAPVADVPSEQPEATNGEATVHTAANEPTHTLFGDAEPTVAIDAPAEAVVPTPAPLSAEANAPAEETVPVEDGVPVEETAALESEPAGDESTTVLPRATVAEPLPPTAPTESIFRQPSPASGPEFEPTRVEQLSDEEQKLAAERAARREARTTALAATAPVPLVAPDPVIVHKRTNDKFWGSAGLFLLRLVLAAILAVRGLNLLTDIPAAQAMFAKTIIPEPGIMAIVTGVAALLIALSLILGLLTRLSGLGIALIGGGALAFVYWGNWSPFVAGRPGFLGDYELLLTAVGILLLCIGAGGWSLDRSVRSGRERNKAERVASDRG